MCRATILATKKRKKRYTRGRANALREFLNEPKKASLKMVL